MMPFTDGRTLRGWGVVREAPSWHFAGLFPTREAAETKATEMGRGYIARFGEQQEGTDNFVFSATENPNA
jgi:hypothetical protein